VLDTVDLNSTSINGQVAFYHCRFPKLNLSYARIEGGVYITGYPIPENVDDSSYPDVALIARTATVKGPLYIENELVSKIDLAELNSQDNIVLENIRQKRSLEQVDEDSLYMRLLRTSGHLSLTNVDMRDANMHLAKIGVSLWMKSVKFNSLELAESSVNEDIIVQDSELGRDAADARIDLSNMFVGRSVSLTRGRFSTPVLMINTDIHRDLVFVDGVFAGLNAARISVARNLVFSPKAETNRDDARLGISGLWGGPAVVDLRFSNIGRIVSPYSSRAWPPTVVLHGATFGGFVEFPKQGVDSSPPEVWFPQWLLMGTTDRFEPEPYQAVVKSLALAGWENAAVAVAYAAKSRETEEACNNYRFGKCLILVASKILIGYGYQLWLAVVWAGGLTILGALIFSKTPEAAENHMPYGVVYSFDMLLPIIKLRERNFDIHLDSTARYYFYFHRLAGWILGLFLVAGLTGVTK
jgi:hypothetical protein